MYLYVCISIWHILSPHDEGGDEKEHHHHRIYSLAPMYLYVCISMWHLLSPHDEGGDEKQHHDGDASQRRLAQYQQQQRAVRKKVYLGDGYGDIALVNQ
jgi:hypothetical protein